eukprot:TRINITY_DN10467_c0_g1_i1.p2 TRINITY_DN10467_c0_g1~~TRINITY_DN10467_c0_g1_i1.p2  ORF type:complete len:366 (+),score=128.29 TRINITY_DN10467_c0_g1_i1:87-1184(+)
MRGWLVRSAMRSPYANLALEERLMRDMEVKRRETEAQAAAREALTGVKLLTYTNEPSVVIGRYQNQWKECNMKAIADRGLHFVRRQSGGGTVYHDDGCMCFSILLPKRLYDPARSISVVARALRKLGAAGVTAGTRNDLWVGENKICGSAFRITQTVAYHHGTLLLTSDLGALKGAIRPPAALVAGIKDRCPASVRSPVTLLGTEYPEADLAEDRIAAAIYDEMLAEYELTPMPPAPHTPAVVTALGLDDHPHHEDLLELPERGTPAFTLTLALPPTLDLALTAAKNRVASVEACAVRYEGRDMPDYAAALEDYLMGAAFRHDTVREGALQAAYATLDSSTSPYEQEHAIPCANAVLDALDAHGL